MADEIGAEVGGTGEPEVLAPDALDGMTETPTDGTTEARFTDEAPADPNDPQYKYWQAAYTRTRQRDREQYGKLEAERQQYSDVLRQFYQSDEYALQVLRQRFPQLAHKLSLDGTPASPQGTGIRPSDSGGLEQVLSQSLGDDLAFLAPRLAPALTQAMQAMLEPYAQQTAAQAKAQREAEQRAAMAQLDSETPGWEAHVSEMEALRQFLASDALTHPKFGNKLALLYKLSNPDMARVDAARSMATASRGRVSTGRPGRGAQPNLEEMIRSAKTSHEAFRLAAEAALREVR